MATAAILAKSAKKFTALTATALVAFSLSACGGGSEEKETRAFPNELLGDGAKASDYIAAKSYVREKKASTLPPFVAIENKGSSNGSLIGYKMDNDDIIDNKATNQKGEDCKLNYTSAGEGLGFGISLRCKPSEIATIELTTKSSGKVTYKF